MKTQEQIENQIQLKESGKLFVEYVSYQYYYKLFNNFNDQGIDIQKNVKQAIEFFVNCIYSEQAEKSQKIKNSRDVFKQYLEDQQTAQQIRQNSYVKELNLINLHQFGIYEIIGQIKQLKNYQYCKELVESLIHQQMIEMSQMLEKEFSKLSVVDNNKSTSQKQNSITIDSQITQILDFNQDSNVSQYFFQQNSNDDTLILDTSYQSDKTIQNIILPEKNLASYKTLCQEIVMKYFKNEPLPQYRTEQYGLHHCPKFRCQLNFKNFQTVYGEGKNKKEAEGYAAAQLYNILQEYTQINQSSFLSLSLVSEENIGNPKVALQTFIQKNFKKDIMPLYSVLSKEGPDHQPLFELSITWRNYVYTAKNQSKKAAEADAASQLIEQLKIQINQQKNFSNN